MNSANIDVLDISFRTNLSICDVRNSKKGRHPEEAGNSTATLMRFGVQAGVGMRVVLIIECMYS